jgi:hypothetical protein
VGVRLVDATEADVAMVVRQLGPIQGRLDRDPDVTVRFVDRLDVDGHLTYVGWPETGYAGEDFLLMRGRAGAPARAVFPFDRVGRGLEIVCERALGQVPHLVAVVNLLALDREVLPLHASAFTQDGTGVLATGWAKGGKTETLLAFARRGAAQIGDEWVYLWPDGTMRGIQEPVRLWHWHVRQLPQVRAGLTRAQRVRLGVLGAAADASGGLAAKVRRPGALVSLLRRGAPVVRRQAYVQVPAARLFPVRASEGRLDVVLLVTSALDRDVHVHPVGADEVARRMTASLQEEREPFMAHYRQFRFAFPDRSSDLVDTAADREQKLLGAALGDRPAFQLRHPYPFALDALVDPVERVLRDVRAGTGTTT